MVTELRHREEARSQRGLRTEAGHEVLVFTWSTRAREGQGSEAAAQRPHSEESPCVIYLKGDVLY